MTTVQNLNAVQQLPDSFSPNALVKALNISKGKAYEIAAADNFPKVKIGGRIIIFKEHFITWLENRIS